METPDPRFRRPAPVRSAKARVAAVLLLIAGIQTSAASAAVLSTTDPVAIAAFQSGRTILGFDEIVVPAGPCFIPLDQNQYAAQGILISAKADGSIDTHVAQLPACGHFGTTQSLPNIIGGGTGPATLGWRESVRFDFPGLATAIGAHTDQSGSNTTLTAYQANGTVITSVSGNQGTYLGISEPGIAYAVWSWNFDQSVAGFSLDNVTFSLAPPVPMLSWVGYVVLAMALAAIAIWTLARRREH
jgi:hypothetical protein